MIKEQMHPRERAAVEAKGFDPVMWHFNVRAQKDFRMRQAHGAQLHSGTPAPNPNQMSMNNTMIQPNMTPVNQQSATPFMHNIDPNHIRNQQEAGMRSQQEGQLVVPASNQPQNKDMNPLQQQQLEHQRLLMQKIRATNPNMSQQELQAKMAQTLQSIQQRQVQEQQAKLQQLQANARMAAQQQMANSQGLGQSMQNTGSNTNQFPTINRPMNSGIAGAASMQNFNVPSGRPQPEAHGPQSANKEFASMLIQLTNQYPELKDRLRREPQHKWMQIVASFKDEMSGRPLNSAAIPMAAQRSQGPPTSQVQGGQSVPMATSLSAGQISNLPANAAVAGMMPAQQTANAAQPAFAMPQGQHLQARGPMQGLPITQADQQQMHRMWQESHMQPIVPQILNNIKAQYAAHGKPFPSQLQTWQQWKAWTRTQPDAPVSEQKLNEMHQRFVRHTFEVQRNTARGPLGMTQASNQSSAQMPLMPQQMPQQGPGQPPSGPFPPQFAQMISQRQARINQFTAQNPQHQMKSDEELSRLLNIPSLATLTARFKAQVNHMNASMPGGMQQIPNQLPRPSQAPTQQNLSQFVPQNPAGVSRAQQQNNLKRPSEDTQTAPTQSAVNNARPGLTEEQIKQMPLEQRKKYLEAQKRSQVFATVTKLIAENDKLMRAPAPIPNMDPNSKKRVLAMLTSKDMVAILSRFEPFLATLMITDGNDINTIKTIVQYRWTLLRQYTPESVANKTFQPAAVFSLTPEKVEMMFNLMRNKFSQAAVKTQASRQGNTPSNMPLTQENLEAAAAAAQEQQQQAGKPPVSQKTKEAPPPAPTAAQPPFQFPADKGQGLPVQYGTPRFDAKNLQLPAHKRARNNTTGPAAVKPEPSAPAGLSVKCVFPACSAAPFDSQVSLDEHVKTVHQPEIESQNDLSSFFNSSLQQSLNLDENFQPRKKSHSGLESTSVTVTKAESKASTPGGMVRGASLNGGRVSPVVKKSSSGGRKVEDVQQTMQIPESWKSANFTLEDMGNIFGPTESGDAVAFKSEVDHKEQAVIDAFLNLDEWKCLRDPIDDVISSEGASIKSKSSPENGETSLPKTAAKAASSDPFYVDTRIEGMPHLENDFDAMFKRDTEDWEMVHQVPETTLPVLEEDQTRDRDMTDDWFARPFDYEQKEEQKMEDEAMAWAETINWDNQE